MTALALATFADEGAFLRARLRVLTAGHRIAGEWTPYATESLGGEDGAHGIRRAGAVGGIAGAAALFAFESWSAVLGYAHDAGGRPLWSWPAFVPAPVEFGALAAAACATALFFRNAGLTRLHHPAFDIAEVAAASQGAFVLAIACDAGADANGALALLAEAGAAHSRLIVS